MATEIRALRTRELDEHAELVFRSYREGRDLPVGSMLTHPDWWRRSIGREPGYAPEQTRVLAIDGRLVASVTCFMRPSTVAGRVVPMVCIGSVCTHPDCRRRGLVRQVLAEAVQWMESQGIVWSFLFGLESIYGGSGWRNLSSWSATVSALKIQSGPGEDVRERPADPVQDLPTLAALHATFAARLTGPMCRTAEFWQRRVLATPGPWAAAPVYRLLEQGGRAIGYYAGNEGQVAEVAWEEGQGAAVLAFLLRHGSGRPLSLPFFGAEVESSLRALAAIPPQADCLRSPGTVTLTETYRGLWRYGRDPGGLVPEVSDTDSLLRYLRGHDYAYWPADRA